MLQNYDADALRSGFTNCIDSRPETGLSFCRLLKPCVNSKFFHIYCLPIFTTAFPFKAATKHKMNLKQTNFAQPNGKSRTVLANERDRVCDCWAVRTRKRNDGQEFYYETIALLILDGKRLGQSPLRKYRSSTKCKALLRYG